MPSSYCPVGAISCAGAVSCARERGTMPTSAAVDTTAAHANSPARIPRIAPPPPSFSAEGHIVAVAADQSSPKGLGGGEFRVVLQFHHTPLAKALAVGLSASKKAT